MSIELYEIDLYIRNVNLILQNREMQDTTLQKAATALQMGNETMLFRLSDSIQNALQRLCEVYPPDERR